MLLLRTSIILAGIGLAVFAQHLLGRDGPVQKEQAPTAGQETAATFGLDWDEPGSRAQGQREAEADIAANRMKIRGFGLVIFEPGDPYLPSHQAYWDLLAEYQIEVKNLGCVRDSDNGLMAEAYNATIEAELERRHGKGFWKRFDRELDELRAARGVKAH